MPLEIIGAGFGRTGTLSLKLALEKLGFAKCYHMQEVFQHPEHMAEWKAAHRGEKPDWEALYRGYRATVDWPSCNLWEEHAALYPDAKVILSTRDPQGWYDSVMNTIYRFSMEAYHSDDLTARAFGRFAHEVIWAKIFDGRVEDRDYAIGVYNAHVQRVMATIPKHRLLVFQAQEGWRPLCQFIGVAVPDEPYPRANTSEEFINHITNPGQPGTTRSG